MKNGHRIMGVSISTYIINKPHQLLKKKKLNYSYISKEQFTQEKKSSEKYKAKQNIEFHEMEA